MTHWLLLPPCVVLGALAFRVRGGLMADYRVPGQMARLSWATSCGLTALAAGLVWWQAAVLIGPMFVATTLPLWGAIDLRKHYWRELALGCLHGLCMGSCAAVWLWWLGLPLWWLTMLGGAAWGPCYALAWWRPLPTPRLHLGRDGSPPETGELWFGLVFAAALFAAVAG